MEITNNDNTPREECAPTDVTESFDVNGDIRKFLINCLKYSKNCILKDLPREHRYNVYKNTGNGISFTKCGTHIVFYKTLGQIIDSESISSIGSDDDDYIESDNEESEDKFEDKSDIKHPRENEFFILNDRIDYIHAEFRSLFYILLAVNIVNIAFTIGRS